MNPESTSSTSSSAPPAGRSRGMIAAQACETCRSRKQKCDELRPKCGLCQRMKLDCRYREPQPTKKDKTLVEILDRLKSLEGKVDQIPTRQGVEQSSGFGPSQPTPSSHPSFSQDNDPASYSSISQRASQQPSPAGGRSHAFRQSSAAHKILTWPAIQQLLVQALPSDVADINNLAREGTAFIVRMQLGVPDLPLDGGSLESRPFFGMQTQASRASGGARVTFPSLTRDLMHRLTTAYFDTFNLLYPFMDRQNFLSDILSRVATEGFDGDADSVLALLVFALGELAIDGTRGAPIGSHRGRPSGIKGGTASKPPGLALFNEARKQIGFVMTGCDLENVQILCLTALYFQSCSHYLDFWRMSVSASQACHLLITCNPPDWNTPRGDLIKRAYWHCAVIETSLHIELDLPLTGIGGLENIVGMPSFDVSVFCEADHRASQASHFEKYYASQIALRRLCADLYITLSTDYVEGALTPSGSSSNAQTATALSQLAFQITRWREILPSELQWLEDDSSGFPSTTAKATHPSNRGYGQSLDPNLSSQQQLGSPHFTTDLNSDPTHYPYVYDIHIALLRTRYYYAKYMVYRPSVFKALHYPDQITQEDAEGVAECLRSCLKWPITLSPPSRHKRLIPYLFCWSQSFLGILIIFHLTRHNPMLRDIREKLCGPRFEKEFDVSAELMIDWIRDLKSSDPFAMWCFKILQPIYNLES